MTDTTIEDSIKAAHYARTRKKEPPPWWPAVEAILNEHGLQAIDFVADFKAAMKQGEQKSSADLEADLAATRELAECYAQERDELKAENEMLRTTLRNLLAYANSIEMQAANADGEHHVMQAARAALEEGEP